MNSNNQYHVEQEWQGKSTHSHPNVNTSSILTLVREKRSKKYEDKMQFKT